MLTFSFLDNPEELKTAILESLQKSERTKLGLERKKDTVIVFEGKETQQMVSLEDKVRELTQALFWENKGRLYRRVIAIIDKILIEVILEYTAGNKFKTAKFLGINRNTLETKITRLKIEPLKFKV